MIREAMDLVLYKFLSKLFLLLCGHAIADYALQSEKMIVRKDPRHWTQNSFEDKYGPWWWTMAAHSLINGLAVFLATGLLLPAISETVTHFISDTLKCAGKINTNSDQIIHITCKLVWAVYATVIYYGGLRN